MQFQNNLLPRLLFPVIFRNAVKDVAHYLNFSGNILMWNAGGKHTKVKSIAHGIHGKRAEKGRKSKRLPLCRF